MWIFRTSASVLALVTALGGFMSWKYSTTSPCEAAGVAIRDEMPAIMEHLAETDTRFRALQIGGAIFGDVGALVSGVAGELARQEVEDKSAVECVYIVGRRELDSKGFHAMIGERMADSLAARLSF